MNLKLTVLTAVASALALSWGIHAIFARDFGARNREIFTEMAYSPAAKSQGPSDVLPDGMVQQPPPEGTLYRGQVVDPAPAVPLDKLGAEDLARVKSRTESYAGADAARLAAFRERGKEVFANNCQACHGVDGGGGAPVAAFGIGATNIPANVGKYSDGELFHIITHGVRTMPPHGDQVRPDDRWKLILHLRKLAGENP